MTYSPSRHYATAGLIALGLAGFSGWVAWSQWNPAWVAAVLFLASAALLLFLAVQPAIEIYEHHLAIGRRIVPWTEIERLDRSSWISPLIVYLSLSENRRAILIYPGDVDSGKSLLRHLRRCAKHALIDGIPYRQFWGESLPAPANERRQLTSPKFHILRPDDEAEVERLFQRLKTVGHLDPKGSPDEK